MFASVFLLAMPFLQMWDGDHMDGDWGWAGWLTMSMGMVLFLGTIIVLAVWGIRSSQSGSHTHAADPLNIARERYARGEITDEDFDRIKRGIR